MFRGGRGGEEEDEEEEEGGSRLRVRLELLLQPDQLRRLLSHRLRERLVACAVRAVLRLQLRHL
jgi:hypothetical protein